MLRYAWRRVGAGPAEDIASEMFAVAWRRLTGVPQQAESRSAGRLRSGAPCIPSSRSAPARYLMIFDPVTGQLLDSEQILTTSAGRLNVAIPAVISYTVYLQAGYRSRW